jgi:hypothetical protein
MRVLGNTVLRRIFGPKRDEAKSECRKLHTCNEELNNRYSSSIIIQVIKSRRMNGRGMLRVWGRGRTYTGFWWENMRERGHLGDPGVDGKII